MVPAREAWSAALKRAAGERGRRRKARLTRRRLVRSSGNRKAVVEEILRRKR
jgi:hypothetical protein